MRVDQFNFLVGTKVMHVNWKPYIESRNWELSKMSYVKPHDTTLMALEKYEELWKT